MIQFRTRTRGINDDGRVLVGQFEDMRRLKVSLDAALSGFERSVCDSVEENVLDSSGEYSFSVRVQHDAV